MGFETDGASVHVSPSGTAAYSVSRPADPDFGALVLETTPTSTADRGALEAAGTPVESGSANHGQELRIPAGVAGFEVVWCGAEELGLNQNQSQFDSTLCSKPWLTST